MQHWIIDFAVSPPFERPNLWSYVLRLEISEGVASNGVQLWSRKYRGMDWMQEPSLSEVRVGEPILIQWERAQSLLSLLRGAQVCVMPAGGLGFHPTSYRVKVSSGSNACEIAWCDEIPPEFVALSKAVTVLEDLAEEYACEA